MRSGSPAQDGGGWPPAQRPRGSGPRSEPHEGSAGRREVPFGPEISWPYGFRPLDPQSREILESGYGAGYPLPATEDYGDPGYSDPSYEGPRAPSAGPAFPGQHGGSRNAPRVEPGYRSSGVPGYHVPEIRDSSRSGHPSPGSQPQAGGAAYPEQWYGNPRLDDRVLDDARPSRPADPRLAGMTYDELRYDPHPVTAGEPGYDEPLDDESWYEELRRGAPAHPRRSDGPQGPGGPPGPAGRPAFI